MFKSHAQCGQDAFLHFLLLRHGLTPRDPAYAGFYVDVGCSHPISGSNSYAFYERGWSGLCIDADPDNQAGFVAKRPRDAYVNCGISDEPGSLPFHVFSNQQHNTFQTKRVAGKPDTFLRTVEVPVLPLRDVLAEHIPADTRIDFMSIDVELYELQAVRGMDFDRFRPGCIVIEAISKIAGIATDAVTLHLQEQGYELIAHTGHDSFFVTKR